MAFKDFVKTVKSEAGDAVEVTKLKAKISKETPLPMPLSSICSPAQVIS